MAEKLRVVPLGGLGEIGKNMMAFELADDLIVVDAGLMFPEEQMLGVDLVIPDVSYIEERIHKLRGILITHAHEAHTGSLPPPPLRRTARLPPLRSGSGRDARPDHGQRPRPGHRGHLRLPHLPHPAG